MRNRTRVYQVIPGTSYAAGGQVDAECPWGLPGVTCDACGNTWATTANEYPTVDLSLHPNVRAYEDGWPVSVDRLHELSASVMDYLPNRKLLLEPGTTFGAAVGDWVAKFGDFAWLGANRPFLREAARRALEEDGVRGLRGAIAALRHKRWGDAPPLVHLEIWPLALWAPEAKVVEFECTRCGFDKVRYPREAILRSSVPAETDIFRVRDRLGPVFVTERFVTAVRKLGLSWVDFSEVELVDVN